MTARARVAVWGGLIVGSWLLVIGAAVIIWHYPYHVALAAVLVWAFVALHRRLAA